MFGGRALPCVLLALCSAAAVASDGGLGGLGLASTFTCNNTDAPVIIHSHEDTAGFVQTPNFPKRFPLPLSCVWIFNNTMLPQESRLHLYFTQFYLSDGFLRLSGLNTSAMSAWMETGFRDAPPGEKSPNYHASNYAKTRLDFVVLRLVITQRNYDHLHMRALEVYNSYGFRLAYETSAHLDRPSNCSLMGCSLNGECLVDFDSQGKSISRFYCSCSKPNRAHRIDFKFSGEHCELHGQLSPGCSGPASDTCSGRGYCRFLSSRQAVCDCDPGFWGKFCERASTSADPDAADLPPHNASPFDQDACPDKFLKVSVAHSLEQVAEEMSKYVDGNFSGKARVFKRLDERESGDLFVHSRYESLLVAINATLTARWLSAAGNGSAVNGTHLAQGLCPKGLTVNPSLPLREGEQFHLTCIAGVGPKRPGLTVAWTKDDKYIVNATASKRYMSADVKYDGNNLLGVLTVTEAGARDNGNFKCVVTDEVLSSLVAVAPPPSSSPSSSSPLPFATRVTSRLHVAVATVPQIEVYPLSLTVLRGQVTHENEVTLHCLADKSVPADVINMYSFRWFKNNRPIGEWDESGARPSHSEFVEPVWFVTGPNTVVKYGLLLKISRLEKESNFTCKVTSSSWKLDSPAMSTEVSVRAYVAESALQTCPEVTHDVHFFWPQTLKGIEAERACPFEQRGRMRLKCEPTTTKPETQGLWFSHDDKSDCVRNSLVEIEALIGDFVSGYMLSGSPPNLPFLFLESAINSTDGRALQDSEWDVVMRFTSEIMGYMKYKDASGGGDAAAFFWSVVPWLSTSATSLRSGQAAKGSSRPFLELFKVVADASRLFASKLSLGSQQTFPLEPIWNSSCDDPMVRIAKQTAPLNVSTDRKAQAQLGNISLGGNESSCTRSVSVTVTSSASKGGAVNFILAVMEYQQWNPYFPLTQEVDSQTHTTLFTRNSTVVTIIVERENTETRTIRETPILEKLDITVQFPSYRFQENDTTWGNLSCGRLHVNESSNEATWLTKDNNCTLKWSPDALLCVCSTPGSIALLWRVEVPQPYFGSASRDPLAVSLCCGGSLTMCLLTCVVLLRQLFRKESHLKPFRRADDDSTVLTVQAIGAGMLSLGMGVIIAAVVGGDAISISWASKLLQFLLMTILSLQLALIILVQCKLGLYKSPRRLRRLALGLSFVLPAFYCTMSLSFRQATQHSDGDSNSPSSRTWFVQAGTPEFYCFTLFCCVFAVVYAMAFALTRRILRRSNAMKQSDISACEATIQRSAWISLALLVFSSACLCYVNIDDKDGMQYVLSFASVLLGVVVFLSYLMSSDGYLEDDALIASKMKPGGASAGIALSKTNACPGKRPYPDRVGECGFAAAVAAAGRCSPASSGDLEGSQLLSGHVGFPVSCTVPAGCQCCSFGKHDAKGAHNTKMHLRQTSGSSHSTASNIFGHEERWSDQDAGRGSIKACSQPSSQENSASSSFFAGRSVSRQCSTSGSSRPRHSGSTAAIRIEMEDAPSQEQPLLPAKNRCAPGSSFMTSSVTSFIMAKPMPPVPLHQVLIQAQQEFSTLDRKASAPVLSMHVRSRHKPSGSSFSSGDSVSFTTRSRTTTTASSSSTSSNEEATVRTPSVGSPPEDNNTDVSFCAHEESFSASNGPTADYEGSSSNFYVPMASVKRDRTSTAPLTSWHQLKEEHVYEPLRGLTENDERDSDEELDDDDSYEYPCPGFGLRMDTKMLLNRAVDKIEHRSRKCSMGDSAPSSEPDSTDSPFLEDREVPLTPPNSVVVVVPRFGRAAGAGRNGRWPRDPRLRKSDARAGVRSTDASPPDACACRHGGHGGHGGRGGHALVPDPAFKPGAKTKEQQHAENNTATHESRKRRRKALPNVRSLPAMTDLYF